MKVYSQLFAAQLENKSSDYSGTITGAVWFHTTELRAKFANGTSAVALLANDGKAVFGTNGTAGNNVRFHRGANTLLQIVAGGDTTAEGTLSTSLGQISARQENYTTGARPAAGNAGRLIWNTSTGQFEGDNGSAWAAVGAGGSGSGGSGIDQVLQKLELENYGSITNPVDNSGGLSGAFKPTHKLFEANLNRDYTSGGSTLYLVWNGIPFSDSDKNCDATTGFTLTGAGATLTTSVTGKTVGTTALAFDKNSSAVEAGVRFDRGTQTLNVSGNTRFYTWIYLASVTGLTNVGLRMYADSTSNFRTFTATTNAAGGAFATGLNLIFIDISTGGTTGGTGWLPSQLSRYQELFVTTGSATQTYAAIQFDGFYFSAANPENLRVAGSQFDVFDNSIRQEVDIDVSNTTHDGALTLVSSFASNVAGGLSGTSRGRVMRSSVLINGDGSIVMDNDATLSGAITTQQSVRTGFLLRASLSGDFPVVVDAPALQYYVVTEITSGTVFKIADPDNTTANLKSGNTIDSFSPMRIDGDTKFSFDATRTFTADATHSSGITTCTVASTTGLAVGDSIVKRLVSSTHLSVVAESAQENFSALTPIASPDGIQLLDTGYYYPNPSFVYGHWELAGANGAEATRNRKGLGPNLTQTGSPSIGDSFKNGKNSASGLTTGNNYSAPGLPFNPSSENNSRFQMSYWVRPGSFSSQQEMMCQSDSSTGGYRQYINTSGVYILNTPGLDVLTGPTLSVGTWYHIVVIIVDNTSIFVYVNGVLYTGTAGRNFVSDSTVFTVSGFGSAASPTNPLLAGTAVAQLVVWRDGPELTATQVQDMYNAGRARLLGFGPVQRYRYLATAQTGQRVSMKAVMDRTTTAVRPNIARIGSILT